MEEYKGWIGKAQDDLRWTKHNLDGSIYYGACFTAQQAAEKAFKGYLLFKSKKLKKIHDLRVLLNECVAFDKEFEVLREKTLLLIPYYIETRYPGFDDFGSFTKQDAEEAYKAAKEIVTLIQEQIG